MSRENVEVVRAGFEAWNSGDMDAMLAVLHADFEYVTSGLFPGLAPVYRGHEGFRDFWRDFRETWDWLNIEIDEAQDADDRVVVLFTFHARSRDGLEVHRRFGNVWTFRDGFVSRCVAYGDWDEALEAAGLSD